MGAAVRNTGQCNLQLWPGPFRRGIEGNHAVNFTDKVLETDNILFEDLANSVPAAAGKQRDQAFPPMTRF